MNSQFAAVLRHSAGYVFSIAPNISEQGMVTLGVSLVPKKSTAWNRPRTKEFALASPTYGFIFRLLSVIPLACGAAEGNSFVF